MEAYKNPALPVEERVDDLLSRMTLEEKLVQIRLTPQIDEQLEGQPFSTERLAAVWPHGLGGTYSPRDFDPRLLNRFQRYFLEETRLGIPLLMMGESLHGVMSPQATVFPQAIGLGATFNVPLIAEMAAHIGREARALGIRQTYAPNLDLSRDPRWGRTEENYGEDPYLPARLGCAYISALQGAGVACSPKHYVAHGSPEGGINLAPVHCGERELRDTMLPPFAAAVQEAGALSIMPAYSEWDGIPLHASRFLMTDLLRGGLGFQGFTVSDFGAITMLHSFHKVAPDALSAGRMALAAGLDMEAPNVFGFGPELLEAARQEPLLHEQIDQAVRRILRVKFLLGLFEEPYAQVDQLPQLRSAAALDLSRQLARESIVLLKNEQNLLPLAEAGTKVALLGPNARQMQLGDYTHRAASERAVGLYDALLSRIGSERLFYAPGCSIAGSDPQALDAAIQAAQQADVAIVALGDNSNYHGGIGWGDDSGGHVVTCGEGFDLHDLRLPPAQSQLLEAVAATGKPVVLVMVSGRPYDLSESGLFARAILQAWYPGEQGGHALCDLLFGEESPSGRLPISFPRSTGHIPSFYNHKISARGYYHKPGSPDKAGRDYVFASPQPLYPFGFGLSYTSFSYSGLLITPQEIQADGQVEVSVTVKNSGARAGKETVLLFLTDCYSRITPVARQLRGFCKVSLQPGESRRVSFSLSCKDLAFINEQMKPEVEPGSFKVSIGPLEETFQVSGPA
ncbi:MAG: hypothetical protein GX173_09340 [Ruminococcaceae bacterium]|nr:hypothetical protein [Oscillospiraceae bacterium]